MSTPLEPIIVPITVKGEMPFEAARDQALTKAGYGPHPKHYTKIKRVRTRGANERIFRVQVRRVKV